jgi:enoyl-CoA hydratase
MPTYDWILYETSGHLARVKLNRPRYRNAQSRQLLAEMDDAFGLAADDDSIRVILLSGEGDHFSSGHDLGTPDEVEDARKRGYDLSIPKMFERMHKIYVEYGLRWRDLPKPTIAMVHGYCIFGGWQIAASMDVVLAADDTLLLPGFIEYFSVPWDLGVRKTKELLFQNRFLTAEEARELGFVNRVVPRAELEAEALALAARFAEGDGFLQRMAKLSINQAQDAQGFRLAVETALSNFILAAQSGTLLTEEQRAAGKRSLAPVDQALTNLERDRKRSS